MTDDMYHHRLFCEQTSYITGWVFEKLCDIKNMMAKKKQNIY